MNQRTGDKKVSLEILIINYYYENFQNLETLIEAQDTSKVTGRISNLGWENSELV